MKVIIVILLIGLIIVAGCSQGVQEKPNINKDNTNTVQPINEQDNLDQPLQDLEIIDSS